MNKIILLLSFLVLNSIQAQKTKPIDYTNSLLLVKNGEATIVFNKKKELYLVVLKDSMLLTKNNPNLMPNTMKVSALKIKNKTFYHVNWKATEKRETSIRKEFAILNENQIWNPVTKTLLIANTEKTTDITEVEYLDKLKNTSQTISKKRNEGYLFTLLSNGDFSLSNKSMITKYSYNDKTDRYEPTKKQ
ncbi:MULTISPECIES: hypothetical protein [Flavobacterium]|uniref:Uncharacterized protein n=2 Tax=Flavobacterium TaxID=237 RepID=A0AA94F296_9FLAO|nr:MULTISPECIES: hypothetical protein [Flavobacterium]OXA75065.1 hypothetical protein B0A56_11650 [Flavobacterium columnare NBRC 100251 = ATCC 23463]AMA48786.1 hypothetical protein AWN65_04565 [Flavobacterium covae]AND65080.1 hypothetical protein AX766_12145 [Flavobacterium covae]MCH4830748.1 hypothetical protein [Flavobacterium columnare]MCH4833315.1 hypothetical protein [Flavobacterium columnare]